MTNNLFGITIFITMKLLRYLFVIRLCALPMVAVGANCDDSTYRKNNPDKCNIEEKSSIGTMSLLGGAFVAGAGAMLVTMSGGGSDSSAPAQPPRQPTMQVYDTVGYTDPTLLSTALSDPTYSKNFENYNEIRLAYSIARGYTGAGSTIAVLDTGDYNWHSVAVTNVISDMIAPGAQINSYRIVDNAGDFISYADIGKVISAADANIFNFSWGMSTTENHISAYDIRNVNQLIRITGTEFLDSIVDAATQNDAIFVWAGGNDSTTQSNALAAIPRVIPEMDGHLINVVAWDTETGALANYSNQCGVTQLYCITAPGSHVDAGIGFEPSGTSFAAPMVSAAIAVIREMWPDLPAQDITEILFVTARDLGVEGVDEVYGWGMLDLERATRPVGAALVPLSDGMQPMQTTRASGVLGRKLLAANLSLTFFDSFNREFTTNLNDNIKFVDRGRGFDRLRENENIISIGSGNFEFGFSNENLLIADGLVATDKNNLTSFIGYKKEFELGEFTFSQTARFGFTAPEVVEHSLVSNFSNIYSASIGFGVDWHDWWVRIAAPTTVIGGTMNLHLPVGKTSSGEILFADHQIDLAERPAIELSIGYKSFTMSYIDNPYSKDEFFIMSKHKLYF